VVATNEPSVCFVVALQADADADADIRASIPDNVTRVCKPVKEELDAIVLRIAGYVRDIGFILSTIPRAEAPAYLPRHAAVRAEHLL
jgi:hypothetical protein